MIRPRAPNGAAEAGSAGWVAILGAVKRPITLFALGLLVLEAVFGIAAARARPEQVLWLFLINGGTVIVLIGVFAVLLWIDPAPLMGTEWLRESLAESLAEAVVDGLHGGIANLSQKDDQVQTWTDLLLWMERQHSQEGAAERQFRQFLVRGIHDRAIRRMPELRQDIEAQLSAARNH